jgi:hypothetical protein
MTDNPPQIAICHICAEDNLTVGYRSPRCSQCHNVCCKDCTYRHIMSILNDEIGVTRPMSCPFGCGRTFTDTEIRRTFRFHHQSILYGTLRYLLYCILSSVVFHGYWSFLCYWYIKLSRKERRDIEMYLRWSLQRGLANIRQDDKETITLQCPGPDCNFEFIVADPRHRRNKQRHENRDYLLWYSPYTMPEGTPENFVDAIGPSFWTLPHHYLQQQQQSRSNKTDMRRLVCPSCSTTYCGLCRNPWMYGMMTHTDRSCRNFIRCSGVETETNPEDRFALAAFSRRCPGCTRRTERIAGCNHISCPCGMHWCYECGQRWNVRHYACTGPALRDQPTCIVL